MYHIGTVSKRRERDTVLKSGQVVRRTSHVGSNETKKRSWNRQIRTGCQIRQRIQKLSEIESTPQTVRLGRFNCDLTLVLLYEFENSSEGHVGIPVSEFPWKKRRKGFNSSYDCTSVGSCGCNFATRALSAILDGSEGEISFPPWN